jgi:hypothetical protein
MKNEEPIVIITTGANGKHYQPLLIIQSTAVRNNIVKMYIPLIPKAVEEVAVLEFSIEM